MRGDGNDPVRDFFQDANIPRIPKGVLLIGILVLLGLSMLMTVFYQVEPDEVAVVIGRRRSRTASSIGSA